MIPPAVSSSYRRRPSTSSDPSFFIFSRMVSDISSGKRPIKSATSSVGMVSRVSTISSSSIPSTKFKKISSSSSLKRTPFCSVSFIISKSLCWSERDKEGNTADRSAACVLFTILRRWEIAPRLSSRFMLSTSILFRSPCIVFLSGNL